MYDETILLLITLPLKLSGWTRLKDFKNEFYKVSSYVDGCHLPGNCKLKLEEVQVEDRIPLPGLQTQYRLEPAEHCEREVIFLVSYNLYTS